MQTCKPVFESLSTDEVLTRCLSAFSQNNNESFHQLVWKYAPKIGYTGKRVVDIAVATATLDFNEGQSAKKRLFEVLGMRTGKFFDN